jgi:hypothetical protein
MAENPRIRGESVEDKFASIEQFMKSISRQTAKRAVVYIPPVPIFIPWEGKVIVPFSGTITDLFVHAGEMRTARISFMLEVSYENSSTTIQFTFSKKAERLSMEIDVEAGTVLRVWSVEGEAVDVLIATAVRPALSEHRGKQYLLEEILALEKEESNALQNQEEER